MCEKEHNDNQFRYGNGTGNKTYSYPVLRVTLDRFSVGSNYIAMYGMNAPLSMWTMS